MTTNPADLMQGLETLTETNGDAPASARGHAAAPPRPRKLPAEFNLAAERAARDAIICEHCAAGATYAEAGAAYGLSVSGTKKVWQRTATSEQRARRYRTTPTGGTA